MRLNLLLPTSIFKKLWTQLNWMFLLVVSAFLILFVPLPLSTDTPQERTIRIEASSFQFMPGEIYINPNDRVTVELVSTDVVHGFSLDGYDFELKADPGQTAKATFVANKAGVFRFRCSVACGNLHPFMIGKLHVGINQLFIRGIVLGFLSIGAAFYSLKRNSKFQAGLPK
ncbi:MAG: hypothetical protein CVU39_07350 [Chloroflexi bacterium HGW-Chloroflexi-10]|nr:MAG: hypothetical protein CVU39_07350 [Chloroflexi bacterium HGW-Chloroflexi-10]